MIAMFRLLASCATVFAAFLIIGNANARVFYQGVAFQKDLDDLVALLKSDKVDRVKVKALAAAIQKKNDDLNDIMAAVYKPTKSKGLGWNPAKKGPGDGIEKRIIDLGKKELTQAEMAKEKNLILRAAYYNLAMYEITKGFAPPKKPGKGVRPWNKHNGEMKAGTQEVLAAIKANDPKALKKAMNKITAGCNDCHTDFRD